MSKTATSENNQYLTFILADEIYALDIRRVREVLGLTAITKIPRVPEFMRGVINLRGRAVPVLDMRLKLSMDSAEDTENTCIIITEIAGEGQETVIGALVDSVREVYEMDPATIDDTPKMGAAVDTAFISGMGRQGEDFVIIFDIEKIFSAEELAAVQDVAGDEADQAA